MSRLLLVLLFAAPLAAQDAPPADQARAVLDKFHTERAEAAKTFLPAELAAADELAVRAEAALKANNAALLDWCKRGGTLIVNYQKTFDWDPSLAPYPITLSNNRTTREDAPVKLLRPSDGISMNRDRLLFDAKQRALELLAAGYKAPEPKELRLPGPTGRTALQLAVDGFRLQGKALPQDVTVSKALAEVLTGGATDMTTPITEDQVQKLEKKAFLALLHTEPTLARMEHMLATSKPLRN